MAAGWTRERLLREVTLALQRAAGGSRCLDRLVACAAADRDAPPDEVFALLYGAGGAADDRPTAEPPAYTTALDARLPGENIVAVARHAARHRWSATQRPPTGDDITGQGATEVLARRIAVLNWIGLNRMAAGQSPQPDAAPEATPSAPPPGPYIVPGGLDIPGRLGLQRLPENGREAAAAGVEDPEATTAICEAEAEAGSWKIMF